MTMAIRPEYKHPSRAAVLARQAQPTRLDLDQDPVIIQFTTREIVAGFGSHAEPICVLPVTPDLYRRAGHHDLQSQEVTHASVQACFSGHELWQLDIRDTDLPLLEDTLHKALSIVYINHLLIDPKARNAILCLEPCLPHRLIVAILDVCFGSLQIPGVTLLSSPTLQLLGAGQRSGLVIDIGWFETVVTLVYEFREISHHRTTRAMSALTREVLGKFYKAVRPDEAFELAEEMIVREMWCKQKPGHRPEEDVPSHENIARHSKHHSWGQIERVLFADGQHPKDLDDHEHGVQHIVHEALLATTADVRADCMAHVIIGGAGARIPGLRSRILCEISDGHISGRPSMGMKKGVKPEIAVTEQIEDDTSDPPDGAAFRAGRRITVRGFKSLGVFSGCSLLANSNSSGLVVLERDRFLSEGLAESTHPKPFSMTDNKTRFPDFIRPLGVWT